MVSTISEICKWYGITQSELREALEKNHVREIILDQVDYQYKKSKRPFV